MNAPIAGALLNAALFLAGVIAAGLATGNHVAVVLALISAGLSAYGYYAQSLDQRKLGGVLAIVTQALAFIAFAALCFGYLR